MLVSSSAVGFYGTSETASFSESSPSGDDFLAKLCVEWEAEAARASEAGKTRVVTVRTGIVLAKEGGALAKMLPVFSLFAGGPLGSGVRGGVVRRLGVFWSEVSSLFLHQPSPCFDLDLDLEKKKKKTPQKQICSWIHVDDLVSLFVEALSNPAYEGPYNGTAPSPVPMAELCSELGATMGRPSWLPVPEFALTVRFSFFVSPPLSPSFSLGMWFDAPRVFAPSTALSRGRRKRAGRERGKKIAFFFFLLRGGGVGELTPSSRALLLSSSFPSLQTLQRPCSAAALLWSSTASGCSPRGPRPRGSRSSTGGSERRSGISTGDEIEREGRSRFHLCSSPCPSSSIAALASS